MVSFGIVIPVKNGDQFILDALQSVANQIGTHTVDVLVQDGGSTDRTVNLVQDWIARHAGGTNSFRLQEQQDSGVAEALNRGFQAVRGDFLTWIGADDIMLPWALSTVADAATFSPSNCWFTGTPAQFDEAGIPIPLRGLLGLSRLPSGFSQFALRTGRHGTRWHGMIQEEGTFWSRKLWNRAGGHVDEGLGKAFDYELWCRFARETDCVQLGMPLAMFRKRPGQLSEDFASYRAEVYRVRQRLSDQSRIGRFRSRGLGDHRRVVLKRQASGWSMHKSVFGPRPLIKFLDRVKHAFYSGHKSV